MVLPRGEMPTPLQEDEEISVNKAVTKMSAPTQPLREPLDTRLEKKLKISEESLLDLFGFGTSFLSTHLFGKRISEVDTAAIVAQEVLFRILYDPKRVDPIRATLNNSSLDETSPRFEILQTKLDLVEDVFLCCQELIKYAVAKESRQPVSDDEQNLEEFLSIHDFPNLFFDNGSGEVMPERSRKRIIQTANQLKLGRISLPEFVTQVSNLIVYLDRKVKVFSFTGTPYSLDDLQWQLQNLRSELLDQQYKNLLRNGISSSDAAKRIQNYLSTVVTRSLGLREAVLSALPHYLKSLD